LAHGIITVISTFISFVLFVIGIYGPSHPEVAGWFATQEGIDIKKFALAWIVFIALLILTHTIVLALNPFSQLNEFFEDLFSFLFDFFIDKNFSRFVRDEQNESLKSGINIPEIPHINIGDSSYARSLEKHIKSLILYRSDFISQNFEELGRPGTAIEYKPGLEDI
jgi:hypothetical protein